MNKYITKEYSVCKTILPSINTCTIAFPFALFMITLAERKFIRKENRLMATERKNDTKVFHVFSKRIVLK